MPTGLTRSPRGAAPTYSLPTPDDEDDQDVPEDVTPAARPDGTTPLGTTGGLVPQQAGTFDRPPDGRLSADPRQRARQSIQRAQNDFEDKQRADNPFIFSNDIKSLSKVGGRRYDAAAIRQGDRDFAAQTQADNAA